MIVWARDPADSCPGFPQKSSMPPLMSPLPSRFLTCSWLLSGFLGSVAWNFLTFVHKLFGSCDPHMNHMHFSLPSLHSPAEQFVRISWAIGPVITSSFGWMRESCFESIFSNFSSPGLPCRSHTWPLDSEFRHVSKFPLTLHDINALSLIESEAHTRRDLLRWSSASFDHIITWNLTCTNTCTMQSSTSKVHWVGAECKDNESKTYLYIHIYALSLHSAPTQWTLLVELCIVHVFVHVRL